MSEGNGSFFKGLLFGGLIGTVIGILYAPRSGKETRENLARRADEIIAKAKEELEKDKETHEEIEAKINEFTHQSAAAVQDSKKRLKRAIHAGVEAYRAKQKKKSF